MIHAATAWIWLSGFLLLAILPSPYVTATKTKAQSVQGALQRLAAFHRRGHKVIGGGIAEALTWDPSDFGPAKPGKDHQVPGSENFARVMMAAARNAHQRSLSTSTTTLPPADWHAQQAVNQWAWDARVEQLRREAGEAAVAARRKALGNNVDKENSAGPSRLFVKPADNETAALEAKVHLLQEESRALAAQLVTKEKTAASMRLRVNGLDQKAKNIQSNTSELMAQIKREREPVQRQLVAVEFSEMDLLEEASALQQRLASVEAAASQSPASVLRSAKRNFTSPELARLDSKAREVDADVAKLAVANTHKMSELKLLAANVSAAHRDLDSLADARPTLQARVVRTERMQAQLTTATKQGIALRGAADSLARRASGINAMQVSSHLTRLKQQLKREERRHTLLLGDRKQWTLRRTSEWAHLLRVQKATRVLAQKRKEEDAAAADSEVAESEERRMLQERARLRRALVTLQRELGQVPE